jgi:uncharacterized protein (DUF736 family)
MDFSKSQGALWTKMDKNGKPYFSGQIEINAVKYRFMAFSNKKEKNTHPDYKLFLSDGMATPTQAAPEDDGIPF